MADWAELYVLVSPRESLVEDELRAILNAEPGYDWSSDDQGESDETLQSVIDDVFSELRWRETVAEKGAGVRVVPGQNREIRSDGAEASLIQTFLCLLACRRRFQVDVDLNEAARLFEDFAAHAVGGLLQGPSRRMGWPFDPNLPRFRDRVRLLAEHLSEPLGGFESVGSKVKDLGLDVVAWQDFEDDRPGRLTVLGQCAIGDDWDSKVLDIGIWTDMIRFALTPISVLAFPWLPPVSPDDKAQWRGLSRQGALLLDRLRLARMAARKPLELNLANRLTGWVGRTGRLLTVI
jgi:hypothetical protein